MRRGTRPKSGPLKVVFHCHSRWSYDADWDLTDIARFFGRMGADVVMMTEHDTGFDPASFASYRAACAAASTPRCTLVPGIEYSSPDNRIHILTWGLSDFLTEHRPVTETLTRVAEAGGAAIFAHPVRRDAWAAYDPDWTPLLSGIEIWNRKSDGIAPGERALRLWQETGLPATTGCDFHRLRNYHPLSNRITPHTLSRPQESNPHKSGPLESGLVAAIRAGEMTPHALGRPLVTPGGTLAATGLHRAAERARRGLVGLKKRLGGGSKSAPSKPGEKS